MRGLVSDLSHPGRLHDRGVVVALGALPGQLTSMGLAQRGQGLERMLTARHRGLLAIVRFSPGDVHEGRLKGEHLAVRREEGEISAAHWRTMATSIKATS